MFSRRSIGPKYLEELETKTLKEWYPEGVIPEEEEF